MSDSLKAAIIVWAVAQGRDWLPPAEDPEVLAAVATACAGIDHLVAHRCEPAGDAGLRVVLGLPAGLDPGAARGAATAVGDRLGAAAAPEERAATNPSRSSPPRSRRYTPP